MSVLSGLLSGINEGIEKQRQEKNKRADIEAENAKARGLEILKGIIGGDIEETQDPQEAVLTQPGEVIKRGLFGKAETAPGRMYRRGNNIEEQLGKAQLAETEAKTQKIRSETPLYAKQKLEEINNAREELELKRQTIANDTTKNDIEKQKMINSLDVENRKLDFKEKSLTSQSTSDLSPSLRKQKIKDTSELTNVLSRNKNTRQYVNEAIGAIDKIPQGAGGLIRRKGMEWFDPKNPILGEWQKIKSVLSDIQLGKLQFTKGAISDREMAFFADAVANNNIASAPRIRLILNRGLNELDSDEEAKKKAYTLNYEEDPEEIFEQQTQSKKMGSIKSKYADLGLE